MFNMMYAVHVIRLCLYLTCPILNLIQCLTISKYFISNVKPLRSIYVRGVGFTCTVSLFLKNFACAKCQTEAYKVMSEYVFEQKYQI